MAMASFKVEFPRRQAMLRVTETKKRVVGIEVKCWDESYSVPVFVWPMPTSEGLFVVEHQDGTVQRVQPDSLTFLGSKELFDQYDWNGGGEQKAVQVSEDKLVRHMVNMSGRTQSDVSEMMGKHRSYVLTTTSRGNSPTAANLAKLAKACGYRFVLEGHGESISVVDSDD